MIFSLRPRNHQNSDFLASRTKTGNPDHPEQKNSGLNGPLSSSFANLPDYIFATGSDIRTSGKIEPVSCICLSDSTCSASFFFNSASSRFIAARSALTLP
jgi:hypothetical protein